MASEANDVVMLEDPQLRKLAKLLLRQEEPHMTLIKSEPEREKYLKQCNDAHDNVISLLDSNNEFHDNYAKAGNKDKADIAKEIHEYIKYGINMSMQCVRNCCLRVSCVEKINTHFTSLAAELEKLDPHNVTNMRRLAKDVSLYKDCMWEYTNKCRSGSARAISKAYSLVLKQEGIKFPELVDRHKNKLGYKGEFNDLGEAEKLEVYNSIIEESGRAKIPKIEVASATVGVALLVLTAGFMVWDIFTAEHKIEAVLRNGLSTLSEIGAFAVQVSVEAAVTTAVADMELGVFVVSLAGFVAGTIAGLLFVAVSGLLVDLIMGSGGNTVPNLDDLKFHSATMPDGMALAYEIAHD